MLLFLYKRYSQTIGEHDPTSRVIRLFIKYFLNFIIPIIYKYKKRPKNKKTELIVSVTTFPKRINKIWIVVESILRQTLQPKLVVLTLSKLQFSSKELLPANLLNLEKEGLLEIIWTNDDLRSHKKYYDVMQKYPHDIIVTIDDDFIYANTMLENLYNFHLLYPNSIITHLALQRHGSNYQEWQNLFFKPVAPTYNIMQYGGSGVLYPPASLHLDAFNKDTIKECCPLADDLWLNAMALLKGTLIAKTNYDIYLMPVIFRDDQPLFKENVLENKNNDQIRALECKYGSLFFERKDSNRKKLDVN